MIDLFNIAKPQGCDIQTFYGSGTGTTVANSSNYSWTKPRGVSHVYMMLIGGGGIGDSASGGASGVVTVWYGAAQHVPDSLIVIVPGKGNAIATTVNARFTSNTLVSLLTADVGAGATPQVAMTPNQFTASGFFNSTNGTSDISFPVSTFLTGGTTAASEVRSNYGYATNTTGSNGKGYFQMQPIIVGVGGSGSGVAGIGCGGGITGNGGPGFCLIASW